MAASRTFTGQRGFTLVEILATVVVLSILAVLGLPLLSSSTRAYSATQEGLSTLSKLRYATERLAREVREVRRNPLLATEYDIAVMSSTTFKFTKTDGVEVTLSAAPPVLTLGYSTPVVTPVPALTDQVDTQAFKYYKADGVTETTLKSEVAFVEINLALKLNAAVYPQRTRMSLRNKL